MGLIPFRNYTNHPLAGAYDATKTWRIFKEDWDLLRNALVNAANEINVAGVQVSPGGTVDGVDVSTLPADIDAAEALATTASTNATTALTTANTAQATADAAMPKSGGTFTGSVSLDPSVTIDGIRPGTHTHSQGSPTEGGAIDAAELVGNLPYARVSSIVGTGNNTISSGASANNLHSHFTDIYGNVLIPVELMTPATGGTAPTAGVHGDVPYLEFSGSASPGLFELWCRGVLWRVNTSGNLQYKIGYMLNGGSSGSPPDIIRLSVNRKFLASGSAPAGDAGTTDTIDINDDSAVDTILYTSPVSISLSGRSAGDVFNMHIWRDCGVAADTSDVNIRIVWVMLVLPPKALALVLDT